MWKAGMEVRRDISAVVLRKKARTETDGGGVSRRFGIANIVDRMQRRQAARLAGMTRQTLRARVEKPLLPGPGSSLSRRASLWLFRRRSKTARISPYLP